MLLINTAAADGVAALANQAGIIAQEPLPARGTSEALLPAVKKVLAAGAVAVADLALVGVVIGPGSFTGIRVGLSAAKGICEGVGCPMVAISRLGLVAASVLADPPTEREILAVLDGGRGEFYAGVYLGSERITEALVAEPELRTLMPGRLAVTCEPRVAERLAIRLVAEPGAESMRLEVLRRAAANDWSDVATVDANYLRRTDAELLVNSQ